MTGTCEIYRIGEPDVVVASCRGTNAGDALRDFWFSRHVRNQQTHCLEPTGALSRKLMTAVFEDGVFGVRVKLDTQYGGYEAKRAPGRKKKDEAEYDW